MKVILTAAGKYERFRRFSYEIPKYLLPVKNRTMLHYVLKGFSGLKVIFVGNKGDIRFSGAIESILEEMCDEWEIKWIDDTSGQAETLMKATEGLNGPFLVHNVDTVLLNRSWHRMGADCVIDIFESSNRDYSYVVEEKGYAKEIREKQVISTDASSGCYMFVDDSFRTYFDEGTQYISQLINKMIKVDFDVLVTKTHSSSDTIVMGTPEEYLVNMNSERLDPL
jgi:NDP-sugar pyrophosphorylase family protein